jgi:hypothetical protein
LFTQFAFNDQSLPVICLTITVVKGQGSCFGFSFSTVFLFFFLFFDLFSFLACILYLLYRKEAHFSKKLGRDRIREIPLGRWHTHVFHILSFFMALRMTCLKGWLRFYLQGESIAFCTSSMARITHRLDKLEPLLQFPISFAQFYACFCFYLGPASCFSFVERNTCYGV